MLISLEQLEKSAQRFSNIQETPVRENSTDLSKEAFISNVSPEVVDGNMLTTDENIDKRKSMLATVAKEPIEFAFERAIGKNDSVYSNFIELVKDVKQKVGRIAVKTGNKNIGYATGFMVSECLMLTNWHVFKTIEKVADSEIQFFYELDTLGNPCSFVAFKLQSRSFYSSNKDLDYCLVAVSPMDITGKKNLKDIGYLYLDPALGKLGSEEQESLNIVHHPDGDYKQLSIRENLFKKITPTTIWYESDTAPGSSGSPVFNDQWQIVALHHMGIGKKNASGEYIDKNGNVIPVIDGKIDESRVIWIANEGIRISVILKDIFSKHTDNLVVNTLKVPPYQRPSTQDTEHTPPITQVSNIQNKSDMSSNTSNNNVTVSFPASLIEANGVINININNQATQNLINEASQKKVDVTSDELDFNEIKKLEASLDLSGCRGYQSDFLGIDIPLPEPTKGLYKFIAKIDNTDSVVLKYYHYSVLLHKIRKMPVISAINVDGDLKKRKDLTERKDVWLRDNRISYDIQLNDQHYKKSGFDRGHMSRREDANWGRTAEDAKRNADVTCMHTNACPQVAALNQSKKRGLWGNLEKIVLEKGASVEKGKTAKISVFNGPIFDANDPVYKDIQVPMTFYKIILWLTDKGDVKATAFKLSQVDLVDNIDFEQIDIDKNFEFKEFQCSIVSLQKDTKLDFTDIIKYDTFKGNNDEEISLNSELDITY